VNSIYSDKARKEVCRNKTGHGSGGGPSMIALGGMLEKETYYILGLEFTNPKD
jgi:hypothetical protein